MWQESGFASEGGAAIGRGESVAFSRVEFTDGSVAEFRVRHAVMDLFRAVQESSITSRAVGAGAASPDSIMKEVRARSRLTPPTPTEPLAPSRISPIFASRFFKASAAALAWGSAA